MSKENNFNSQSTLTKEAPLEDWKKNFFSFEKEGTNISEAIRRTSDESSVASNLASLQNLITEIENLQNKLTNSYAQFPRKQFLEKSFAKIQLASQYNRQHVELQEKLAEQLEQVKRTVQDFLKKDTSQSTHEWMEAIMSVRDLARALAKNINTPKDCEKLDNVLKKLKSLQNNAPNTPDGEPSLLQKEIAIESLALEQTLNEAIENVYKKGITQKEQVGYLIIGEKESHFLPDLNKENIKQGISLTLKTLSPINLFKIIGEGLLSSKNFIAKGRGHFERTTTANTQTEQTDDLQGTGTIMLGISATNQTASLVLRDFNSVKDCKDLLKESVYLLGKKPINLEDIQIELKVSPEKLDLTHQAINALKLDFQKDKDEDAPNKNLLIIEKIKQQVEKLKINQEQDFIKSLADEKIIKSHLTLGDN